MKSFLVRLANFLDASGHIAIANEIDTLIEDLEHGDTAQSWERYHNWLKSLPADKWLEKTKPILDLKGNPRPDSEVFTMGMHWRNCPVCDSTVLKKV